MQPFVIAALVVATTHALSCVKYVAMEEPTLPAVLPSCSNPPMQGLTPPCVEHCNSTDVWVCSNVVISTFMQAGCAPLSSLPPDTTVPSFTSIVVQGNTMPIYVCDTDQCNVFPLAGQSAPSPPPSPSASPLPHQCYAYMRQINIYGAPTLDGSTPMCPNGAQSNIENQPCVLTCPSFMDSCSTETVVSGTEPYQQIIQFAGCNVASSCVDGVVTNGTTDTTTTTQCCTDSLCNTEGSVPIDEPAVVWVLGPAGASCDSTCTSANGTCSQSELDLLTNNIQLQFRTFNLALGEPCSSESSHCQDGTNDDCMEWGAPYIHQQHVDGPDCQAGNAVSACATTPSDSNHRRLCPCPGAPASATPPPRPSASPLPRPDGGSDSGTGSGTGSGSGSGTSTGTGSGTGAPPSPPPLPAQSNFRCYSWNANAEGFDDGDSDGNGTAGTGSGSGNNDNEDRVTDATGHQFTYRFFEADLAEFGGSGVSGKASVVVRDWHPNYGCDSNSQLFITSTVDGLQPDIDCATADCGQHVHSGTSCQDVSTQGGHLLDAGSADPFINQKIRSVTTGVADEYHSMGHIVEGQDPCEKQHTVAGQSACNDTSHCGDPDICASCRYDEATDHCSTGPRDGPQTFRPYVSFYRGTCMGGASAAENITGRPFVVHDQSGTRVSCGILTERAQTGRYYANLDQISASQKAGDRSTGYGRAKGQMKNHDLGSMVQVFTYGSSLFVDGQVLSDSLLASNADFTRPPTWSSPASGGLHVHGGTSCENSNVQGGHYYDPNRQDPWGPFASLPYGQQTLGFDWSGTMSTVPSNDVIIFSFNVIVGTDFTSVLDKPFIFHDATGVRHSCGVLYDGPFRHPNGGDGASGGDGGCSAMPAEIASLCRNHSQACCSSPNLESCPRACAEHVGCACPQGSFANPRIDDGCTACMTFRADVVQTSTGRAWDGFTFAGCALVNDDPTRGPTDSCAIPEFYLNSEGYSVANPECALSYGDLSNRGFPGVCGTELSCYDFVAAYGCSRQYSELRDDGLCVSGQQLPEGIPVADLCPAECNATTPTYCVDRYMADGRRLLCRGSGDCRHPNNFCGEGWCDQLTGYCLANGTANTCPQHCLDYFTSRGGCALLTTFPSGVNQSDVVPQAAACSYCTESEARAACGPGASCGANVTSGAAQDCALSGSTPNWVDVDLACPQINDCTVLADNMMTRSCDDYCRGMGLACTHAWEECDSSGPDSSGPDDSCNIQYEVGCSTRGDHPQLLTSDLLCECQETGAGGGPGSGPPPGFFCGDGCCDNGDDWLAFSCPMRGGENPANCPQDCLLPCPVSACPSSCPAGRTEIATDAMGCQICQCAADVMSTPTLPPGPPPTATPEATASAIPTAVSASPAPATSPTPAAPTATATYTPATPTATATYTPATPTPATYTPAIPTATATYTPPTPTATASDTPATPTATATDTPAIPTATATDTPAAPTSTATYTPATPSATATGTPATPTPMATDTPATPTATATDTPAAPTSTATYTPATPSATATDTPATPTPMATYTPATATASYSPATTATATDTPPTPTKKTQVIVNAATNLAGVTKTQMELPPARESFKETVKGETGLSGATVDINSITSSKKSNNKNTGVVVDYTMTAVVDLDVANATASAAEAGLSDDAAFATALNDAFSTAGLNVSTSGITTTVTVETVEVTPGPTPTAVPTPTSTGQTAPTSLAPPSPPLSPSPSVATSPRTLAFICAPESDYHGGAVSYTTSHFDYTCDEMANEALPRDPLHTFADMNCGQDQALMDAFAADCCHRGRSICMTPTATETATPTAHTPTAPSTVTPTTSPPARSTRGDSDDNTLVIGASVGCGAAAVIGAALTRVLCTRKKKESFRNGSRSAAPRSAVVRIEDDGM